MIVVPMPVRFMVGGQVMIGRIADFEFKACETCAGKRRKKPCPDCDGAGIGVMTIVYKLKSEKARKP
jgi:hypothetical protein